MSKILFHVSHNFESSFLSDRSQYFVTSIFKSQLILLELGCPCKQRVKNFGFIETFELKSFVNFDMLKLKLAKFCFMFLITSYLHSFPVYLNFLLL